MKDCVTVPTESGTLPPNKRTNYAYGMVMDVDAFRQEQVHFEWKHALGNRLLHGYGTVCGLQVQAQEDGAEVNILVEPGYALNPTGRWIWVETQLCALLNAWVQGHRDEGDAFLAPGANRVYVTLCYEECPTDLVPIAGRACATEEDSRAPSRILESHRAEFTWEPPEQIAEDAARALGQILAAVTLTDDPLEDESSLFLDLVLSLGETSSPPFPSSSPPDGSPPASPPEDGEICLWRETACDTVQQALVIWATEVCPRLQANAEECILLACVDFEVDLGGAVLPDTVMISDCERPVLVPTRLQQELFCLLGRGTAGVTNHGDLEGLEADDHLQYLTEGRGDARYSPLGHTHTLDELSDVEAPAPAAGDALTWNDVTGQWEPQAHAHALDDLSDVNTTGATDGEVLTRQAGQWVSAPIAAGPVNLDDLADVNVPAPADGNLLVFDDGANQWQAQPAAFVAHPLPAGPFAIVAAGWFASDGSLLAASYNDLTARALAAPQGDFVLLFDGYVNPQGEKHMYIVKGTIQDAANPGLPRATFGFVRFQDNGIRVRILQVNGEPIKEQGFMVEISAYSPPA